VVPPPETLERIIATAAETLKQDSISALTRNAVVASVEGQEHGAATLGISLNFNLVNSYAVQKAVEYRDLLVRKGGSMIGGEFKPWLKDAIAADRKAITDIVTDAIKNGTPRRDVRKQLETVFTAQEHNSGLVAYQETRRLLTDGSFDRWEGEGIQEGTWIHLDPQINPRPEHQARHGRRYALTDPIWNDLDDYNCHCSCEPVIPAAGSA